VKEKKLNVSWELKTSGNVENKGKNLCPIDNLTVKS
jgi:hypothetical protein